ncbi:SusC/RagA family TonB-linked outer membrane protein [Marinigracilibium pacificum]|uniref:TonB-dependent receptor n=1 Tax=Marinigracilibium pacificum TaxID=2729599 RepID=A0A848J320_9BACT|nr:TonB-dependent receptor [Marinigracilibium pacificum]NMM48930.1 TonB-dependent receptor [Marinigracilibium pacificum]
MKQLGLLYLLLLSLISVGNINAQQVISGKVTDFQSGEPVPGTNIIVKGTSRGTTTDFDGNYSLQIQSGDSILVFSSVGFDSQEMRVNGRSKIDISLMPDIQALKEVVVVGYGTQKKQDISSSVSTIDQAEFNQIPTSSFDAAIQGRASGLNISSPSGTPGGQTNINIRGATSISASSQPLFIIDGIPVEVKNNSALNSNIQPINPLAELNPNDIESITVLKDASAAAIYGSRGANGVILITTKRGSAGRDKLNIGYYAGFSKATNVPDMMSSSEWIGFLNAAAEFDGLGQNYWNEILGDPNDADLPNYNVYDDILRTGVINNADISYAGGDEKFSYYLSGNYFNQTGIQIGQGYERISGRVNVDYSPNDKVKISTTTFLARGFHDRTIGENDEYGVVVNAQAWDPRVELTDQNGVYVNPFDTYSWWALENPLLIAQEYVNTSKNSRLQSSLSLEWYITPNLTFKSSGGLDFNTLIDKGFVPKGYNQTDVGLGTYGTYEASSWINENTLKYTNTFDSKHFIDALVGITFQESVEEFSVINASGYSTNQVISTSAAGQITGASDGGFRYGLVSYLGRLNYTYDNRYTLTFTGRADGSSRFGANNKYGFFPSGSIGWNMHNESFFPDDSFISLLKLRGSYGAIGNQSIGSTIAQATYRSSAGYNGQGGTSALQLGNPNLTWEKTIQSDIGIDVGLFDNRVEITADYFKKDTDGLLLNADIPGSTGFKSLISNNGKIVNEGVELSISTVNIESGDFRWTTTFNITWIDNEVIDVINDGEILSRNFILKEGEPLSTFYLIKFLGVDPQTGDAVFLDANSDGIINLDDRVVAGNAQPDYFGGFTNNFSWRGWNLSVFFQYQHGNQIFNQSRYAFENYGTLKDGLPFGNQNRRSLDYWKKPGDVTSIPRPTHADEFSSDAQFQRFSTQYLEDGSYLRLKNVRLGYTFPSNMLDRMKLQSLTIYGQAQNLLTFTNYLGFDPEVSTNTSGDGDLNTLQGEDFGTLGQARTFTIGLNIGL